MFEGRENMVVVRWAKSLAISMALVMASSAGASTSGPALITNLIVIDGKVFFSLNSSRTTPPGCATVPNRWVFNAATLPGQAMLSILLSFKAMNKTVSVQGINACPDWSDTETVGHLFEA